MSTGRIGKNTILLYIRSFVIMLISLFTSRVILDKLGIDDYGLYNTIGSITAFLSFLSSALALSTSRYITYDLGTGNKEKLRETFQTINTLYIILAIGIFVIMVIVGSWLIETKIVYDPSRSEAVIAVLYLSVTTVVFSLISGPFNTLIIAHEDMTFFAYVSIFEAMAKLGICYLISITSFDRLVMYAFLQMSISIILLLIKFVFSKSSYEEVSLRLRMNVDSLKKIGSFTGWSLIGRFAGVLSNQGINILTNMFFGPAVVAARALSLQVDGAVNTFVENFMTAVKPQIVKRHAAGQTDSSNRLIQVSTVISFILATIICFPIILNTEFILNLWLKVVPEYAVFFIQIILIQSVYGTIENGMYTVFFVRGRVKENALISPMISFSMFFVVYFLFKTGFSPVSLSYCYLFGILLSCLIVKPLLIIKLFGYSIPFFIKIVMPCLLLNVFLAIAYSFHVFFIKEMSLWGLIVESVISVIYIIIISYYLVIDVEMRSIIKSYSTGFLKIGNKKLKI